MVDLTAIYLAWAFGPAAGLAAGYLALVNAALHIGPAIAHRAYNPGLATACLLFVPLGALCVAVAGAHAGWQPHIAGLTVALLVHATIVVHVLVRRALLNKVGPQPASAIRCP